MTELSGDLTAFLPPDAHPWLVEFARSPYSAFDKFIRGYSDLEQYNRADVPDAAVQIFGNISSENSIIVTLNECIVKWLSEVQKRPLSNDISRRRRQIGQLCDLFELISRLELAECAKIFFYDRARITNRLTIFNEGDDRDARLKFFAMLAIMQPVLAENKVDVTPLASLWHELCANAGDGLSIAYLDVGLLGLRRFPKEEKDSEVARWFAGLIHWGLSQPLTERDFMRKWHALKFIYPRTSKSWRQAIGPLVKQKSIAKSLENAPNDLLAWLSKDKDLGFLDNNHVISENSYYCPTIDEFETIEQGIEKNLELTLKNRLSKFIYNHSRFAILTGVDEFLSIAFHRTGTALVKTRNKEAARQAIALAHDSMLWQPSSSHCWALWADALEVLGQLHSCEMVRREHLRRLPFHIEAVTQLAEFLIADNRADEALDLIKTSELLGIANEVALATKVRIVSHLAGVERAKEELAVAIELFPNHAVLHLYKDSLDRGRALRMSSEHYSKYPLYSSKSDEASDMFESELGELSKISRKLIINPNDTNARSSLENFLFVDPEQVLTKIIAARHGFWTADRDAMPGFAVAFESALNNNDIAALELLGSKMPRLRALTLVARAIFGDEGAANEAQQWIVSGGNSSELKDFQRWISDRWHEDRDKQPDNILSFAEFAIKRKEMILAGTRLVHEGLATSLKLAA